MDLIIFRGVLEHVVNPKDYLLKAKRTLKVGGYILITATPNLNSLCADLFRNNFNQHIPAEHIIHFSDEHFKSYLKDNDINLVSERVFYEETPYANIYEDAKKITKAISLKENNQKIDFPSPAWYGNMMTLLFKKEN
jgi:ubiquinone/menaquinone biosynthesis C-methylase UbiE